MAGASDRARPAGSPRRPRRPGSPRRDARPRAPRRWTPAARRARGGARRRRPPKGAAAGSRRLGPRDGARLARQLDDEASATARRTLVADRPTVALHPARGDGEPEPGARLAGVAAT